MDDITPGTEVEYRDEDSARWLRMRLAKREGRYYYLQRLSETGTGWTIMALLSEIRQPSA